MTARIPAWTRCWGATAAWGASGACERKALPKELFCARCLKIWREKHP